MKIAAASRLPELRGCVFYDASCRLCCAAAARFAPMLLRRGFQVLPLQSPAARELNLAPGQLLKEMRLLTRDGQVFGGAAALLNLAPLFWWARPLCWIGCFALGRRLIARAYTWVAAHRYCLGGGACSVPRALFHSARAQAHSRTWRNRNGPLVTIAVAGLFVLPAVAASTLQTAPPWLLMWVLAATIWFGLKWVTFIDVWRMGLRPSLRRFLVYMLAWPNTDALTFLDAKQSPTTPPPREWFAPLFNACLGLTLLYAGVRLAYPVSALLSGWVGMIGLVLVLHFGGFQLLALMWRCIGINATPVMRSPLKAASLAEFWGRRWNTGFSAPARRYLHGPLARRIGLAAATACVFLVSGLLHEIVISVPAGAGFGLPTVYFLVQALALQIERSQFGRRLIGWPFVFLVTAGPAFLLFHPSFVHEVVLPFLTAIGALKGVAL